MTTNDRCGRGGEGGDVHRPNTCVVLYGAQYVLYCLEKNYPKKHFFQKKYSGVEGKGRGMTSTHLTVYMCNMAGYCSVVAWTRRGAVWTWCGRECVSCFAHVRYCMVL